MAGVDPFTAGLSLVDSVVSRIWPDATEEEKMKLEALKVSMASELAIHKTNQAEAQHPSLFVAGWRPFIGWCGGLGVAYSFIVQPFGSWLAAAKGLPALPLLDTSVLMSLVMTMLGFGGMRMYEGLKGVKRSNWTGKVKDVFNAPQS